MRLIKNDLEVPFFAGCDCVSTSEQVQMIFNDRNHFIEICEYVPNEWGAAKVYRVELWALRERPTIDEDVHTFKVDELDTAHFGTLAMAMRCLRDTLKQIH